MQIVTKKTKRIVTTIFLVSIAIIFKRYMQRIGGAFAGAGHGTYFFGYIVVGPKGGGLAIWPLIAGMLPWRRNRPLAVALLAVSVFPVIWAAYVYMHLGDEMDYFLKVWHRVQPLPVAFLICFCVPSVIGIIASVKHAFLARNVAAPD